MEWVRYYGDRLRVLRGYWVFPDRPHNQDDTTKGLIACSYFGKRISLYARKTINDSHPPNALRILDANSLSMVDFPWRKNLLTFANSYNRRRNVSLNTKPRWVSCTCSGYRSGASFPEAVTHIPPSMGKGAIVEILQQNGRIVLRPVCLRDYLLI